MSEHSNDDGTTDTTELREEVEEALEELTEKAAEEEAKRMAERDDGADDVRHALEQRPGRVADEVKAVVPLRQRLGRALAHVLVAHRVQEPCHRGLTAAIGAGHQVLGPLCC